MYLPLVTAGLPQMPGNSGPDGLSFAKEGFRALMAHNVAGQDLKKLHMLDEAGVIDEQTLRKVLSEYKKAQARERRVA